MTEITHRHDFVMIFDVQDGNPNGDPDAGNLPRIDPETGHGLVSDVCLKRKVRNYVQLVKTGSAGYDVYIKEKAVLGNAHVEAFKELGFALAQERLLPIPAELQAELSAIDLPDGFSVEEGDNGESALMIAAIADKRDLKEWIKENKPEKSIKRFLDTVTKNVEGCRPTQDETARGGKWMCERYFDVRAFGAVLSLKSAPNCGQVRGPIQLTFARSVEPIVALEHSITRMAVATQKEADNQGGDNRTMGRKSTVPYGLYVAYGFVNPAFAKQTHFTEEDLSLLWTALTEMFEHDRSAARGLMSMRKLIVFKHATPLGNAPAHRLFDRVKIERKDKQAPARAFSDYSITIGQPPEGVTVEER